MSTTLNEKIERLTDLQKETSGTAWIFGYSVKRGKYYIAFSNKNKRFENAEIGNVFDMAIDYILVMREPATTKFSVYK